MNQHFNKKNIEAAIRVALTNPVEKIYINGERSQKRYYVKYSQLFDDLILDCENENGARDCVYTAQITRTQKCKKDFVDFATKRFYDKIKAA